MVANIRGYTPNYSFKLINFDTPRWHTLEYSNWNMVDAMFLQNGTPQLRGVWQNNTLYLEGDRVFDEETSAVYRCLVEHESAELGTFAEDRTLHPTYWSLQLSGTPVYRGEWQPGVTYVLGDIVYIDQYEYFLCTQGNVSSGDFPSDATKWQTIFDATQVVADAEAAKDAAYQFSLNAAASADDALESENNAETAEIDAEAWANDARAASGSFRWEFSSGITIEDPTIGRITLNSATPTAVTEIYLSAFSSETGNPDVSAWVETWDDSTNPNTRGTVQIRKVGAPEQFLIFNLTGSIVDNGSWLRLPVAYVSHSGTLTNGEPLSVGFVRAGNVGPTGTGGGDMLKANNLSDVASIPTSRTNLGLGTAQIPTFSQVLLSSVPSAATHAATKEYVDGSPSLYVSDTAPPGVLAGSLWWDSDKGTLYVLYNDGTSTQWVQAVATPGLDTTSLVKKAGDTMTGLLTLSGDPDTALKAATKQYVDSSINSIISTNNFPNAGYLKYNSATQIGFYPKNGDLVKIFGALYRIPTTGVLANNTNIWVNGVAGQNLVALTVYYVAIHQVGGVPLICFWSTPPNTRTTDLSMGGNVGVEVINGAPAHSIIGMIRTDTNSQFQDAAQNRWCISWFNRVSKTMFGSCGGSTASVATVPIAVAGSMLNWAEEAVDALLVGQGSITGGPYAAVGLGYDGANAHAGATFTYVGTPDALVAGGTNLRAEGYHYYQSIGGAAGGSGTLTLNNATISAETRG